MGIGIQRTSNGERRRVEAMKPGEKDLGLSFSECNLFGQLETKCNLKAARVTAYLQLSPENLSQVGDCRHLIGKFLDSFVTPKERSSAVLAIGEILSNGFDHGDDVVAHCWLMRSARNRFVVYMERNRKKEDDPRNISHAIDIPSTLQARIRYAWKTPGEPPSLHIGLLMIRKDRPKCEIYQYDNNGEFTTLYILPLPLKLGLQ